MPNRSNTRKKFGWPLRMATCSVSVARSGGRGPARTTASWRSPTGHRSWPHRRAPCRPSGRNSPASSRRSSSAKSPLGAMAYALESSMPDSTAPASTAMSAPSPVLTSQPIILDWKAASGSSDHRRGLDAHGAARRLIRRHRTPRPHRRRRRVVQSRCAIEDADTEALHPGALPAHDSGPCRSLRIGWPLTSTGKG